MGGGRQIRIGLEVLRKADGSIGANISSADQGERYLPVREVSLIGEELTVLVDSPALTIKGIVAPDRRTIESRISQGDASDPIVFRRVAELPPDEPSFQVPKPPFEYANEEVRFHNVEDDVWLAGTVSRPMTSDIVPAVVFVGGSGPTYRDYGGTHPFPLVLADYLVKRGFAVLRYDKRGVYKSTGHYLSATEENFARDAAAAYRYLTSRTDSIDSSRIGYIGHSEGSQVSTRAIAEFGADAAFIVSMAGVGLSPIETTVLQDGTETEAAGASSEEVATLRAFSRRFYQAAIDESDDDTRIDVLRALYDELAGQERDTVVGWFGDYGRQTYSLNVAVAARPSIVSDMRLPSPAVYWAKISAPVLLLFGGLDSQVPAREHLAGLMMVLNHETVESKVFPAKNHMFQTAVTGAVDEYGEIEEVISTEVLEYIADWLVRLN
jgi:pimeloyl-ACP methyl ester carboxylesterase